MTRKEVREGLVHEWVTNTELARYANVDPRTSLDFIREHEIKPRRIGGRTKYSSRDIARYLGE